MVIEFLVVYVQVFEDEFVFYVDQIMEKIVFFGLVFFFYDFVRYVFVKFVLQFLSCVQKVYGFVLDQFRFLWDKIIDKFFEVFFVEFVVDILVEMYQCFYEFVEVIGGFCFSFECMGKFIDLVIFIFDDYKDCVVQCEEEYCVGGIDDVEDDVEEFLMVIEDDQIFFLDMNKVFYCVFKYYGESFFFYFECFVDIY